MLKPLPIPISIFLCTIAVIKIGAIAPVRAREVVSRQPEFVSYIVLNQISHPMNLTQKELILPFARRVENPDKLLSNSWENAISVGLSQRLYGISKSLQKKMGWQEAEIDDGTESLFREYGVFF